MVLRFAFAFGCGALLLFALSFLLPLLFALLVRALPFTLLLPRPLRLLRTSLLAGALLGALSLVLLLLSAFALLLLATVRLPALPGRLLLLLGAALLRPALRFGLLSAPSLLELRLLNLPLAFHLRSLARRLRGFRARTFRWTLLTLWPSLGSLRRRDA